MKKANLPEKICVVCGRPFSEKTFGLSEKEVIPLMRRALKPGSFRRWRRRVTGRITKHRKRFKACEDTKGSFE